MSSRVSVGSRPEKDQDRRDSSTLERGVVDNTAPYNVDLALGVEKREKEMSFLEVIKFDLRQIRSCLAFSGTIILEGYGLAMITYFFVNRSFLGKFGVDDPITNERFIAYKWKVILPLVAQLGAVIGLTIASPLSTRFGYRNSTIGMLAAFLALVLVPAFTTSLETMMVGFLFQGIPWGFFQVISPAYASEVSSIQMRPILTTWNNLCWVIGQFVAAGIAKGFNEVDSDWGYRFPIAAQWIFGGALLLWLFFVPESPYWHLQRDDVDSARRSTRRLVRKGSSELAEEKLALMRHTLHQELVQNALEQAPKKQATKLLNRLHFGFLRGTDKKRTEIASMIWLFQATCGACLIGWAPVVMKQSGLSDADSMSINIALPGAGIIGTLASWWLMRYAGRRPIYVWGLLAMGALLAMCGGFHWLSRDISGWASGGVLIVYTAVYDLTVGPICYTIVSEIPSIRFRTATLAMARAVYLIAGIVSHVVVPKMLTGEDGGWNLGARTAFPYAALCILGAVYTAIRIPETKDLSAREIDLLFERDASSVEMEVVARGRDES